MKVKCSYEILEKSIEAVGRLTTKHISLPVLSCVYLKTEGKSIVVRATNLNIGVEIKIPAIVEEEGETAIPGNVFLSTISAIKSKKDVSLEVKDGNLYILTDKESLVIKCMSTEDFPTLPQTEGQKYSIPKQALISGIKSVSFSCATSDIKPEIASVYIYPHENEIIFVGTDSFRLAEKKVKLKKDIHDFNGILLPVKNVADFLRILEMYSDSDVTLTISKNQISVEEPGFYMTSRVVDGIFPDYRQIIPKENSTSAVLLKKDLVDTLKLSSVFIDKFGHLSVSIDPKAKKFEITTKNSDIGEHQGSISAALTGEAVSLNINQRYINEVLSYISEDSIELLFSEEQKAVIVRGVGNNQFTYLVMPMNR